MTTFRKPYFHTECRRNDPFVVVVDLSYRTETVRSYGVKRFSEKNINRLLLRSVDRRKSVERKIIKNGHRSKAVALLMHEKVIIILAFWPSTS